MPQRPWRRRWGRVGAGCAFQPTLGSHTLPSVFFSTSISSGVLPASLPLFHWAEEQGGAEGQGP